jgi:nicotinic acid mononucleotide adenylyltransferase
MNKQIVEKIHQSGARIFLAITGGGVSFVSEFLSIPGASQNIVGVHVPYSKAAFDDFIGEKLDHYMTQEGARKLAVAAYNQAEKLERGTLLLGQKFIGVGVSCSLSTLNERSNRKHKIFVVCHSFAKTQEFCLELVQGRRRQEEENCVKKVILSAITYFLGCLRTADIDLVLKETAWYSEETRPKINILPSFPQEREPIIIYPGSFNPVHAAHCQIKKMAERILGGTVIPEISITNTDKASLDYISLAERQRQWGEDTEVLITDLPTFVQKSNYFAKKYPLSPVIFVVGADVWNRIWDAKYAGPIQDVYYIFRKNNTKFLVFGRGREPLFDSYNLLRVISQEAENFNFSMSSRGIRKALHEHQ